MSKARCGNCKELVEAETVEELGLKIENHKKECKEKPNLTITSEVKPISIKVGTSPPIVESMQVIAFQEVIRVIGEMRDRNLIMTWYHKTSGYIPYSVSGIISMLKEIMSLTDDQSEWAKDYLNGKHKQLCSCCIENIGYGNIDSYCSKCNKKLTEEYFKKEVKEDGKIDTNRSIENGE